ncbi:MAG: HNH endonuclease [Microcoleus sp. SIO2G3]|nr:HNH endonuclease [Microcoleus sp. SIO2G3]
MIINKIIGNLYLLSPNLNSEASNNCFDDKKEVYKKAHLMHLKDIVSDNGIERNVWNEDAINNRREQLINFAIDQWQDLQQ